MKIRARSGNVFFSLFLALTACLLLLTATTPAQKAPGPPASPQAFEPVMVPIKGGQFMMGSEKGADPEKPAHAVIVSDFEIGKYEITNDQFAAFVQDTNFVTFGEKNGDGRIQRNGTFAYFPGYSWKHWNGPGSNLEGRGKHPVVQVSWDDGVAYAQWLSKKTGRAYSLPTEAQWEYACRGGTTTEYWWGDTFDQTKINSSDRYIPAGQRGFGKDDVRHTLTMEVGSLPANPFGIHEILGNVWDWVLDYATPDYYQQLVQANKSPVVDPKGADSSPNRVIKGGGWNTAGSGSRCAARFVTDPPTYHSDHVGIRVVRKP